VEPREYERTAAAEDQHWWFRELRMMCHGLLRGATDSDSRNGRALDVGCGTGGNLRWIERRLPAVGLDLSPLALAYARRRVVSPLVRGTLSSLPFRSARFELVTCTDVLYHERVADDAAALREIRRVLRPGGLLVVNVPAFDSLRSAHDRAMHTARRYSRSRLKRLILEAGLRPVRVVYWNGLLLPPAALIRWLRKGRGSESEITPLPGIINGMLHGIARLDAAAALRGWLPAGLSVAALARRES
jgi:SAM-dependent methyltransferase